MVKRGLLLAAFGLCLGVLAGDDMKDVMSRLKALEDKNKDLEHKLKAAEARPAASAAVDKALASSTAKLQQLVTVEPGALCCPLKIGGYLDFSYQYNMTRPDNHRNNLRVFDQDSNGFNLHQAEVNFISLPTKAGEAGFRIDFQTGTDQRTFSAQDNFTDPTTRFTQFKDFDLQQAYIEYIANVGSGITIDAGKFVTWAGQEVIEAADNINSSRSYLFGYAIPFTHTGIRATYNVLSGGDKGEGLKWTVGGMVSNGWDNIQDQNDAKTFMFMSNLTPVKWFNWVLVASVGDEQVVDERARLRADTAGSTLTSDPNTTGANAGNNEATFDDPAVQGIGSTLTGRLWDSHDSDPRIFLDTTFTFTPWEKFTFAINADWAHEGNVPQFNGPRNRTWYGVAGYLKYQFHKDWYVANRTEYFNDENGVRTGRNAAFWETTLTVDWALSAPLHVRFEYRHDDANINAFSDTKGVGNGGVNQFKPLRSDKMDTIMMQWLYKF